jgi:xylulokinase
LNELLLGVDIGTSSSKGVLVGTDGHVVARATCEHQTSMPRPGWFEHDAESVWWADFTSICTQLHAQTAHRVAAVGVSGIGPCVLPVDAQMRPLRPAILYGVDTRATREIAEQTDLYGESAILERGGSPLTSQAVGPKLAWLARNEPEVWAKTRRFMMASSYVVGRLTGEYVLDHHSASQSNPLYDLRRGEWNRQWAAEIAPNLELPRLVWPSEVVGTITPGAALGTGLSAGTPVIGGTIDAWSEAFSVGVSRPGDAMLMYGTTMFIVAVADKLRPDRRLWGTRGLFPGHFTAAAGMATSGALTGWFRNLAGEPSYETLIDEAEATPAGADGVVALPYFAGERTPLFDPRARGALFGLTLRHGRGHLYRALLEGTAYGVRHNLETMAEAMGSAPSRLVAVGGGTRGGLWTQIVSDVTGTTQEVPRENAGASYGDALLAAIGTGLADPATQWNETAAMVAPNPRHTERYDSLYRVYRQLYAATKEQAHTLADFQSSPAGVRTDPPVPAPAPTRSRATEMGVTSQEENK